MEAETPALINYKLGQDKLNVTILEINVDKPLSAPYVVLTIGDHKAKTAISNIKHGKWNESFTFSVSFHFQLFGVLQLDLWDSRMMLLPDVHIGRAELKMNLIHVLPETFTSWYELWDKERSDSNTTSVSSKRSLMSESVGAVHISVRHRFTAILHPHYFPSVDEAVEKSVEKALVRSRSVDSMPGSSKRRMSPAPVAPSVAVNTEPVVGQNTEKLSEEVDEDIKETAEFVDQEDARSEASIGRDETFMDKISGLVLSKETNTVLKSITKLLAAFGQGLEISNASLLSGILTLEKFYIGHVSKNNGRRVLELDTLEHLRYFYRFAMASYGWKGLNFFGKGQGIFTDGSKSDADKKALLEFLKMPEKNLLEFHVSKVDLFRPGYYIAIDNSTDSMVLCIRGTMSTMDTLTDLVCEYAPWKDGLVHSGIKTAGLWFMETVVPVVIKYIKEYKMKKLILIGHSMGGATVSMLAMIIQDYPELITLDDGSLINVTCLSYAPPPICSLNLAKRYNHIIKTIVVEDDFVCRLSYGHMMDLKTMIICAVETERQSASLIIELWKGVTGTPRKFSKGALPALNNLAICREKLRTRNSSVGQNIKLYLGGTIYFLTYEHAGRKPFSSMMPKYKNLDAHAVRSGISPQRSSSSQLNNSPQTSPLKDDSKNNSPKDKSNFNSNNNSNEEMNLEEDLNNNNNLFKRVIVEEASPELFSEIIMNRTMFLQHIPNAYDKALDRASQTLMMDLTNNNLTKPD